jgi:outer membrane protein W
METMMRCFRWQSGEATRAPGNQLARARAGGLLALAFLVTAGGAPLGAQSGGGYLLGRPSGTVTQRGGYSHASAGSDLFDEVTQNLTLKKSDFSGFSAGVEMAIATSGNLDLALDVGLMRTNTPSHYRTLVDNNNAEIQQSTQLTRVPLAVDAKYYLAPRGRSIGSFAWIPSAVTPFVGAGAGMMWYRFRQSGDFVNYRTNVIFPDTYSSDGFTPMAQGIVGAEVTLTPRLALTGDARYLWTKRAALSADFTGGFQPIDLSGAVVSLGLTVRL